MKWDYDNTPAASGWYAALVCYDSREGAFPVGAYWDGKAWDRKAVVAFGDMRDTEDEAKSLAYDHDPDDPTRQSQS